MDRNFQERRRIRGSERLLRCGCDLSDRSARRDIVVSSRPGGRAQPILHRARGFRCGPQHALSFAWLLPRWVYDQRVHFARWRLDSTPHRATKTQAEPSHRTSLWRLRRSDSGGVSRQQGHDGRAGEKDEWQSKIGDVTEGADSWRMSYLKVKWNPSFPDEPMLLYSELDRERWEVRKVEFFKAEGWSMPVLEALSAGRNAWPHWLSFLQ